MEILYLVFLVITLQCAFATDSSDLSNSSDSSDESECKIKYSYTLWIGDDVDEQYTMKLKSDCNIKFIDAMDQAAAKDSNYIYTKTVHPLYGAFITSIAGVASDYDLSKYWMIYELDSEPDVDNKPPVSSQTEVGVSSLDVLDGYHYLFWFKTEIWQK